MFRFPAIEPEADVEVRIWKRHETFVYESLFLNQVTGNYLWVNKERTFHANAWTCCFLFSPVKITSLRLRRTSTSSSIYFFTISTFYVIIILSISRCKDTHYHLITPSCSCSMGNTRFQLWPLTMLPSSSVNVRNFLGSCCTAGTDDDVCSHRHPPCCRCRCWKQATFSNASVMCNLPLIFHNGLPVLVCSRSP